MERIPIPLQSGTVQCAVTSPPYWGLRDYGTARWEGGEAGCDHLGQPKRTAAGFNERYFGKPSTSDKQGALLEPFRQECGKCGAQRIDAQIGLEPTPDAYVAALVGVFREVWRVLRDDGTLFLNLGDSYASTGGERTYGSWDGATGRGPGARRYQPEQQMTLREDLTPAEVAYVLRELAACKSL